MEICSRSLILCAGRTLETNDREAKYWGVDNFSLLFCCYTNSNNWNMIEGKTSVAHIFLSYIFEHTCVACSQTLLYSVATLQHHHLHMVEITWLRMPEFGNIYKPQQQQQISTNKHNNTENIALLDIFWFIITIQLNPFDMNLTHAIFAAKKFAVVISVAFHFRFPLCTYIYFFCGAIVSFLWISLQRKQN